MTTEETKNDLFLKMAPIPERNKKANGKHVEQSVSDDERFLQLRTPQPPAPLPYVSVVVPVYNDQAGIDQCLVALSEQTWPQDFYEVIVVENGSTPAVRLNPAYAEFARMITCSVPGAYSARNAGFKVGRGEFLALTDADCRPAPDWIEAGVSALLRTKENCIIGGEVVFELSPHPTAVERYQYLVGFMQKENIEKLGFTATANLFVARPLITRVGMFNAKLFSAGDREWCWRAQGLGFHVVFDPSVRVLTRPRQSLISAVRQARRIAGGRYGLTKMNAVYFDRSKIKPHRTGHEAIRWIILHPDISVWQKIKVLGVAMVLKIYQIIEKAKLFCGSIEERV